MPFNIISTPDIIGGNSGSPVINISGEVVGIIFDRNIESLPWNFEYRDSAGRSIEVDSRAILESLRNIYHADGWRNELTGARRREHETQSPEQNEKAGGQATVVPDRASS